MKRYVAMFLMVLSVLLFSCRDERVGTNDMFKNLPIEKGQKRAIVEEYLKVHNIEFSTDPETRVIHAILRNKANAIGVSKSLQIEVRFGSDGLVSDVERKEILTGP